MEKTKMICVRVSEKEYKILVENYISLKKWQKGLKFIYKEPIETFSDYIRLKLKKGLNE